MIKAVKDLKVFIILKYFDSKELLFFQFSPSSSRKKQNNCGFETFVKRSWLRKKKHFTNLKLLEQHISNKTLIQCFGIRIWIPVNYNADPDTRLFCAPLGFEIRLKTTTSKIFNKWIWILKLIHTDPKHYINFQKLFL